MDIIEDNINLEDMYTYHINELDSSEYNKYKKYLNIFFSKIDKKDKYEKDILNGKYILIDKKNSNKKIIITPSQFINIHQLYYQLKDYSDIILNKISILIESKNNITEEDRKIFNELKIKYLLCKEKLININNINKEFYEEMELLFNKKIEKSNDLEKYYYKRKLDYNTINIMIPEKLKNILINYFKENKKKIPSLLIINKIAKNNNVPSKEIEKWFQWIENIYIYRSIYNEINKINKEIYEKENNYDINTKYMIIKKPIIDE